MTIDTHINQREKQRLETRGRILEAALAIFAEKGFDATSVRDIAGSIGVNHGLIRHHFQNKEKLWKEAVRFLFDRMEAELAVGQEADEELDELERLKNSIRRYVRYCARHPEHARIMVQQSIHGTDRFSWMIENFIAPQHKRSGGSLRDHRDAGYWPNVSEISITYTFVAAAQMPFVLAEEVRAIYGVDPTDEAWVEQHADAMIELFFNHRAQTGDRS